MRRLHMAGLSAVLALLTGCAGLPPLEGRSASAALANTADTRLARSVAGDIAAHPGQSGIHAMPDAREAFAARILLAEAAQRSLDVQYYIWHQDQTGMLLFEALWNAAERGVRVRLLLDDNNTGGMDATLAALDAHPHIEVRLYNPFVRRDARLLGYLSDFKRLNRRMHNKSFTADAQVSVVGGRNVGNEYFGAGTDVLFADLDVLAIGPAVAEVSREFDLYWNSASAYPAASLLAAAPPSATARLSTDFAAARADPQSVDYIDALRSARFVPELLSGRLTFDWAAVTVVYDDPAKTLDETTRPETLLLPSLLRDIGDPVRSFDLISPYFVPGREGTTALSALAERGVRVRVLTNSLAASDVAAVHAGYAKWRVELLRAGVQLFEFKPSAQAVNDDRKAGASSGSALHAKTFAADRQRIFVGSFNFDPRSALLNTEMGLVIDSPILAAQLAKALDEQALEAAYEVRLAADGRSLEWIERGPAGEQRYDTEPGTTWFRRAGVGFISVLPIDWLL